MDWKGQQERRETERERVRERENSSKKRAAALGEPYQETRDRRNGLDTGDGDTFHL